MDRFLPFILAIISLLFYHLALPPVGWWPLVFLAPIGWLPIILMKRPEGKADETTDATKKRSCAGRIFFGPFRAFGRFLASFYGQIWGAAVCFWGATVFWIGYPHPALWIAWAALCGWLAVFFPFFIAVSRILIRRFRCPVVLAPAIAWIGIEWFRKHLLGGFSFGALEHALYLKPSLIQTAEIFGEYGVGALIVLWGTLAGVAFSFVGIKFLPRSLFAGASEVNGTNGANGAKSEKPFGFFQRASAFVGAVLLIAALPIWGESALRRYDEREKAFASSGEAPLHLALLQDGEFLSYPIPEETNLAIHNRYMELSSRAAERKPLDLIIWPEGTFARPFYAFSPDGVLPGMENLAPEVRAEQTAAILNEQEKPLFKWIDKLGSPVILGASSAVFGPDAEVTYYNSAFLAVPSERQNALSGKLYRYDKHQRIMFGEYIPFIEFLPDGFPLKTLCIPIAAGTQSGAFRVAPTWTAMTTICFESSIPHFIANTLRTARREGEKIDFLISISNDGWFRGAAENELHTATYVFRAIENRTSFLAATHGGTSLWIDPAGRIRATGTKGKTEIVPVDLPRTAGSPFWGGRLGRIPPICAVGVVLTLLGEAFFRKKSFFCGKNREK